MHGGDEGRRAPGDVGRGDEAAEGDWFGRRRGGLVLGWGWMVGDGWLGREGGNWHTACGLEKRLACCDVCGNHDHVEEAEDEEGCYFEAGDEGRSWVRMSGLSSNLA